MSLPSLLDLFSSGIDTNYVCPIQRKKVQDEALLLSLLLSSSLLLFLLLLLIIGVANDFVYLFG